jgi:peptidoglycan/LPS O-acetylase OafA/YrhL
MQDKQCFAPIDFKTRFPALDGIRALAVLLVFADHYGGGSHGGRILNLINVVRQRGWVGVDLFFVLSGFLITGILYDTRTDSQYFKRFFARRSLRIFPVFYIVAIVLLLLTPIFKYQWHWLQLTFLIYMGNFFGNYNFSLYEVLSGNHKAAQATISHFWSLCVEEQFYLMWPLAVWFIRDRVRLLWSAAGTSLLALALRLAMLAHFSAWVSETWIVRTLPFRMDSLLVGAILALVLRGPNADEWQRSSKWVFLTASAGVLAIFRFSPNYDSPWLLSIGLTLTALASVGLIGCTLRPTSAAFQLFYWKPLRILGKYSYGFYIYHLVFRWAWIALLTFCGARLHSIALAGIVALSCNLVVTFLVAKFSYDWIEVRFLRYKRHFEYDSEVTEHKHAFTTK